jgi:hypothetical protein
VKRETTESTQPPKYRRGFRASFRYQKREERRSREHRQEQDDEKGAGDDRRAVAPKPRMARRVGL